MLRSLALSVLALSLPACTGAPIAEDDGSDAMNDSDSEEDAPDDGSEADSGQAEFWFDVGWGQSSADFVPLVEGDDFPIVFGTQGSAMWPIIIRGGDFALPPDPNDWQDDSAPILELWLDIEGHNDGFGGHFKRIANYPLGFEILGDGTYQSIFIAIILPDDKTPEELADLPATLWLELDPIDKDPIATQFGLTVGAEGL